MLISDSHKLILMLPQKCGSATLQKRFAPIHDVEEFGKDYRRNEEAGRFLTKHIDLELAMRLEGFKKRGSHLKACFVRNPYDRVYSWFRWTRDATRERVEKDFELRMGRRIERNINREASEKKLNSFRRSLRRMESAGYDFNVFLKNYPRKFKPVTKFTHHDGLQVVEFLGRMERFEEDFEALCNRIGYQAENTEMRNVKERHPTGAAYPKYLRHFTRKSIKLINRHMSEDFTLLGYEMEDPASYPNEVTDS